MRVYSCCYCCSLRVGCIVSALWLLAYYGFVTKNMYELKNSGVADTSGAIILGSAFLIGAGSALALLLGALIEKKELIIVFLVMQFVVNTVELFYIILALMHGMEYNKFVFYVLPLFLLIYIIIVAYSYFRYIWEEY